VIKHLRTPQRVEKALSIYHTVILPMECCEQPDLLREMPHKERITLFANAGCALTCPARTCYASVSRINKQDNDTEFNCSQQVKERERRGMVDFDLEQLVALGFRRFKLLRARPGAATGY